MNKILIVSIIINSIIACSFAQDEVSELDIESDGITLIKILTNPGLYDGSHVSVNGYVSVKRQNQEYWNIFLDRGACKDFDSWNSIQLTLLSKFISKYTKNTNNIKTKSKIECFRVTMQGEFVDQSKLNIYDNPVGVIKVTSMSVPFDIEVDKED